MGEQDIITSTTYQGKGGLVGGFPSNEQLEDEN